MVLGFGTSVTVPLLCPIFKGETVTLFLLRTTSIQPDLPTPGKTCVPQNEDSQHKKDPQVQEEHQKGCRMQQGQK